MAKAQSKITYVFLSVVWLAVVIGAVFLAVTRYEEYGVTAIIAMIMAIAMLVIFVLTNLPRKTQDKPGSERMGRWMTGVLILCAIAVLIYSLIAGWSSMGLVGKAVLILFAVIFINIFRDFLKDTRKGKKKRKSSA